MLRSRLSSFVAVRLLGAEPIGCGADWMGSRLEGAIWRRTDCVQSRFGGGPIVCRADLGAILRDAMVAHRCFKG